jgi:methyltransferase
MVFWVLLIVGGAMLVEARRSRANERALRARGAAEPRGDVYAAMRVAYPAAFVGMALEGWARAAAADAIFWIGAAVFVAGKAVKYWAIAALGPLWTFRVLVLPEHPRVASGPYRYVRHPNYVGVVGELVGVALALHAPVAGSVAIGVFAWLLARRVAVETRALATRSRSPEATAAAGGVRRAGL